MKTILASALVSLGLLAGGMAEAASPISATLTDGVSVSARAKVKPAKRAKKAKKVKAPKAM